MGTINRVKKEHIAWEKIFANHKHLTRIHEKLLQPTIITTKPNLTEKWAKNLNRYFSEKDIQVALYNYI